MTGSTIVIRLRAYRGQQHDTTECFNGLRDEAAAEIERFTALVSGLEAERDALRARIAELAGLLREAHDVCTTRIREPVLMARIAARIDAVLEGKDD